jgi:hypothetical protein
VSTPGADDFGFTLLPATPGPSAEDRLNAAALGALDDPSVATPDPTEDAGYEPLGYSWAFDWSAGRFFRQGVSPAVVTGTDALRERCMMALNVARFQSGIFSRSFGFEEPHSDIGREMSTATAADFERRLREALVVLDGVTDVQDVDISLDRTTGVIYLNRFTVVNDEEVELPFADIQLVTNGGA